MFLGVFYPLWQLHILFRQSLKTPNAVNEVFYDDAIATIHLAKKKDRSKIQYQKVVGT